MAISDIEPIVQKYEAEFDTILSQMSIHSLFNEDSMRWKIRDLLKDAEEAVNLNHSDAKLRYDTDWGRLANDFPLFNNDGNNGRCRFSFTGHRCDISYLDFIPWRELNINGDYPYGVYSVDIVTWTEEDVCTYCRRVLSLIDKVTGRWTENEKKIQAERKRIDEIRRPFEARQEQLLQAAEDRVDADLRADISDLTIQYVDSCREEWNALKDYYDEPFNEESPKKIIIRRAFDRSLYCDRRIYNLLEKDENYCFDGLLKDLIFGIELRGWEMTEQWKSYVIDSFWKKVKSQKSVLKRNRTRQTKMDEASKPFREPDEEMKKIVAGGYEYKRVDPMNSRHYDQHTFTSPKGNKVSICSDWNEDSYSIPSYAIGMVPILFDIIDLVISKPKSYSSSKVKTKKELDMTVSFVKGPRGIVFLCPLKVEHTPSGWYVNGYKFTLDKNTPEEEIESFKSLLEELIDYSSNEIAWWKF